MYTHITRREQRGMRNNDGRKLKKLYNFYTRRKKNIQFDLIMKPLTYALLRGNRNALLQLSFFTLKILFSLLFSFIAIFNIILNCRLSSTALIYCFDDDTHVNGLRMLIGYLNLFIHRHMIKILHI
jgi:hypothetical protein